MSMPAFARRVMELEKKVKVFEAYRYMRIGGVVDVTAPDLPLENCMWADGSLALFDFWPELKAKYENGGFSGLLLPCDCSDEDKTTYPLKWVPDSPNPTGLFVPRLIGLFARYWGANGAGAYQEDAVQPGATEFYPEPCGYGPGIADDGNIVFNSIGISGNISVAPNSYADNVISQMYDIGKQIAHARFTINQRFADRTRPENVGIPVALYLGRTAEV